jgi:hypothetical protein
MDSGGTPLNRLLDGNIQQSNVQIGQGQDIVDSILQTNNTNNTNNIVQDSNPNDNINELIEYLQSEIIVRENKLRELSNGNGNGFDEKKNSLVISIITLIVFSEPVFQQLVRYIPNLLTPTGNPTFLSIVIRAGLVGVLFFIFYTKFRNYFNC